MDQPLVFLNGRTVPQGEAHVPLNDAGFVLGATVTEQLRTFGGQLFHLDQHLQRLQRSLAIVGIELGYTQQQLAQIATDLVGHNVQFVDDRDDVGLSIFATPGPYAFLNEGQGGEPCLVMHTYRLPFELWVEKYEQGQALHVTDVRQTPVECWPAELKCRSRMHYHLADRAAKEADPGARAILCDEDGYVLEATTANLLVYRQPEGLIAPPSDRVLPGISWAMLVEIAADVGLQHSHRLLKPAEVDEADEVLLSSTPYCLLPVTRWNRQPIADGKPGAVYRRLLAAWSERVGIDIVGQAQQFARR